MKQKLMCMLQMAVFTMALAASVQPRAAWAAIVPGSDGIWVDPDDYVELLKRASRGQEGLAEAEVIISSMAYDGQLRVPETGTPYAEFRARARVSLHGGQGPARVSFLSDSVALHKASIAGREQIVSVEDGFYQVVTERRGVFDINFRFFVAVHQDGDSSRLHFEQPRMGQAEFKLAWPEHNSFDIEILGAQSFVEAGNKRARVIQTTLSPEDALDVQWFRPRPPVGPRAPKVYSEVASLASISDGVLRLESHIQSSVLFAGVDRLAIDVPKGSNVTSVEGPMVEQWRHEAGLLEVRLSEPVVGTHELAIITETALDKAKPTADLPLPRPKGVERIRGFIGVVARGNVEVQAHHVRDARVVDVRSMPQRILDMSSHPLALAYKYLGASAEFSLALERHEEVDLLVTVIDQARVKTTWSRGGRRLSSVVYQLRNNREQFLRLRLPQGARLWSASVAGRTVEVSRDPDGGLLIPLIRSQTARGSVAAFEVELVYVEEQAPTGERGRGQFSAELPRVDVPITYVAWAVHASDKARLRRRSLASNLRRVRSFSDPIPDEVLFVDDTDDAEVKREAKAQADDGSLGQGLTAVEVRMPRSPRVWMFEKLLVRGERLHLDLSYRGLR